MNSGIKELNFGAVQYVLLVLVLMLPVFAFCAEPADPEVDIDLMQFIDETNDSLVSNITLKKQEESIADAQMLAELFGMVEAHFADWGKSEKALELSKESAEIALAIVELSEKSLFEDAAQSGVALSNKCKSCHELFDKSP